MRYELEIACFKLGWFLAPVEAASPAFFGGNTADDGKQLQEEELLLFKLF
jgi:hypothetical protein